MEYILLIAGFVLLIKGADFFVEGSSSVARLLRIPTIIIGLTIVAFGTSAPELAVSLSASLADSNDIAVGNVIGSNIFNLLVVIGACGVVAPLAVDKKILYGDYLFGIMVTAVMLALFIRDRVLSRVDGCLLLAIFGYFLFQMIRNTLASRAAGGTPSVEEVSKPQNPVKSVIFIAGGLSAIVWGGDLVVNNASLIAASFGLSETLIGLTVVAFGTSLPELVTSVVASKKGENSLALGNVIGSNIFNILMVLALSAAISPMKVDPLSVFDAVFLIVSSCLVWYFAKTKGVISRAEGVMMLLLYGIYTVYIIVR
ncbi:MAG: calcium/sodium antiporter [Hungatella sp.]|jgi:cation:H+ antiporter|nr:calcium/sodium antiporter [Hungatella sp.]MCI9634824.1 calcium/sodium antiporter [Hungatella sp.]